MDWTKIKTKYFLFTDMSKFMKGDLVDLLCLTAHLERMPCRKEALKLVHHKSLSALENKLIEGQEVAKDGSRNGQGLSKDVSRELQGVLKKVLEDVERVKRKRNVSRETSRRYDKRKREEASTSDVSNDATEKRREDKRREDNKKKLYKKRFEEIWLLYPKRVNRKESCNHFLASVKTDEDWERIQTALSNYKRSKSVMDNYIQNGSTWFNNWKDWVEDPVTNEGEQQRIRRKTQSVDKSIEKMLKGY